MGFPAKRIAKRLCLMDLPGQLSNPLVKTKWVDLQGRLIALRASGAAARPSGRLRSVRAQGQVRDIIDRLLQQAGEPMRARELHSAVEEELGETVPWSSIGNCLARNSAGPATRFERVGYGRYRSR